MVYVIVTSFAVRHEQTLTLHPVYTCQKSPGCGFFLWDDDAKAREASAVLSNSRTEPSTPRRANTSSAFITPPKPPSSQSKPMSSMPPPATSPSKRPTDAFEWSDSDDDEVVALADQALSAHRQTQQSRKAAKTAANTSPGKRPLDSPDDRFYHSQRAVSPSPQIRNGMRASSSIVPSPEDTPRVPRFREDPLDTPTKSRPGPASPSYPPLTPADSTAGIDISPSRTLFSAPSTPSGSTQALATDVFALLRDANITLPADVATSLRAVCDKHALRSRAFELGRDATRKTLKQKLVDLARSNERIRALEAENDVNRRIINRYKGVRESTVDSETTQATTVVGMGSDDDE